MEDFLYEMKGQKDLKH